MDSRKPSVAATAAPDDEGSRLVREATRFSHNSRSDVAADWWAAGALLYSLLLYVVSIIPAARDYFSREDDIVSETFVVIEPNLIYASLVLAIAIGLRRRLAEAWWIFLALVLLLPTLGRALSLALDDATSWGKWVGLVINVVLIALFFRAKPQFRAHNARGADLRALAVLLIGGLVTVLVGGWLAGTYGTGGENGVATIFGLETLLADLGFIQPDLGLSLPFWVRAVVNVLGAAVVLGAAYVWFRPPRESRTLQASDEARIRALLREFGGLDSLGYFATGRDKVVVWDTESVDDAMAGVSYRVVGSVALASGNPVGDPQRWGAAMDRFREYARSNGLSAAVMAAGEEGAAAYQAAGMDSFEIGDEAILNLTDFSLEGRAMKDVRQAVSRMERRGYTLRAVRHSTLAAADFAALETAAAKWRGDGGEERGFSMALGRLGDPLDGDCVLVAAYDADEQVRGFLSFVPWGRNGLSLDLMRRDPAAENGLIEFLVAGLARRAGELGASRVSLNFAMFREAFARGESLGAGPIARGWRRVLMIGNSNWQLESLYRSNAKYSPDWQPRYICFDYSSDLPRVGMAAGNAEGFLATPSLSLAISRGKEQRAGAMDRSSDVYAAEVAALMPAEEDPLVAALSLDRLPEQVRVRRKKLEHIREMGINPYPVGAPRTATLAEIRDQHGDLGPDEHTGVTASVVGRVMLKRDGGKLCFATLRDGSGDLQVMLSLAEVGQEPLDNWKHIVDLGDHVSVTGEVMTSRKGELSISATSWVLTAKAVRPLPGKYKGLSDPGAHS